MEESIKVRFIIQIAGKPVENVEKALNVVKEKLGNEGEKFTLREAEIIEPEYDEESTLYSGFIEATAIFGETRQILDFILDYTPNSVEIEEPESMELDATDFTGILNDMSNHVLANQTKIRKLNAHIHSLNKKIEELGGEEENSK